MANTWIDIKEALRIAKSYPKGPHTKSGLIWAGKKGKFIQKLENGIRWKFDQDKLKRYCEISNKPTLESISEKLGASKGSVKYCALKNQINFHTEMGRLYLEDEDEKRIIELYKESHNG